MNRRTRDEILSRALDRVDSSSLDQKDRPGGVIQPNALSIGWLQDGLDLFHRVFPWRGLITTSAVSFTSGTNTYTLPADYVMDKRDGVRIVQTTSPRINKRLLRRSLEWFLSQDSTSNATGEPACYTIVGGSFRVYPWPDKAYTGELWYYQLPPELAPNERPNFPDDYTLIEYVHLCGKEWTGEKEPGTAIMYARQIIAELKKAGLGEESENDAFPLDRGRYRPSGGTWDTGDSSAWMGSPVSS